jgi:hypothetical protein
VIYSLPWRKSGRRPLRPPAAPIPYGFPDYAKPIADARAKPRRDWPAGAAQKISGITGGRAHLTDGPPVLGQVDSVIAFRSL